MNQGLQPDERIGGVDFSPNSKSVVYGVYSGVLPDRLAAASSSIIFSVPPDGSGEPQQVSDPSIESALVENYQITADSKRVIYITTQYGTGIFELFNAAIDGSGPIAKLSISFVEGGGIERYRFGPDDIHVVYQADQDIDDLEELYAAELTLDDLQPLFLPVVIDNT